MARLAGSTSRNVDAVFAASAGSTSTATRLACGTSSCSSASRFAASSKLKTLMPVRLPAGRPRLATRPSRTGSSATTNRAWDRRRCRFGGECRRWPPGGNDGGFQANQISCQLRQPFRSILGPAIGDGDIIALDKARLLQTLAKRDQTIPHRLWRSDIEEANDWHR